MPNRSNEDSIHRRVAVLVYDGLCAFEFGCCAEIFGLARPELTTPWYTFSTVSEKRRAYRGQYGTKIFADAGLDALARAGTIVIPGWTSIDTPVPDAIVRALRKAHARGARLLSICSGVVVLAATGLLDGRRATTHWRYADTVQRRFPTIEIDPNVLYVDEGQVLTSAGSAAGLDLCLHLVRRDHGPDIANQVARRLVIPPHREGGQAQFVERPVMRDQRDALSPVLDLMQRQLDKELPLAAMASKAAMSERTFIRRFKEATGTTPGNWLTGIRLDHARSLLERSNFSVERVAEKCGLGSGATLRHHFREKFGTSPVAYRQRFSASASEHR